MSEQSTHLRTQADKCRRHATAIGDTQTQDELRKLAAEYVAKAEQIESKEREQESVGASRRR
jgi:hypothetical protein